MFNDTEIKKYLIFEHQLGDAAREYVANVRNSDPFRMVGTHATNNLSSWTPSSKMNRTISAESGSPEYGFYLLCEYDNRVKEIWDQPEPIMIEKVNSKGVRRMGSYNPDYLILTESGPEVVEVKDESSIEILLEKYPSDWIRTECGDIEYLPAKEWYGQIGVKFRVYVYKSEWRYLIENIELLLKSREEPDLSEKLHIEVHKAFKDSFAYTLKELQDRLNLECCTELVQLIDKGVLKANLKEELLSSPESCIVSVTDELLMTAREVSNAEKIYVDGMITSSPVSKFPSRHLAEQALNRLARIERGESGRNIRRWKALIREGVKSSLNSFQSLIPKHYKKGNRRRRINIVVAEFVKKYLIENHANKQGISVYRSYKNYEEKAKEKHPLYAPITRQTFTQWLNQLPPGVIAFGQGGKRKRNAAADPSDPEKRRIKAQASWQRAAIDHYEADIYLIFHSGNGVVNVKRPWVTAMVDLYSNVVLAIAISFSPPSRRSVAKVIRECVRRHGMLPMEIIVDRGSDFRSVYFASLLAHYSIKYTLRPASHPRFGGEVEALFGEFKKQWLCQRPGNLADYKEVRAVDDKYSPKKTAILKPADFIREIKAFCNWRDNKCRGTADSSALERFNNKFKDFPFMSRKVQYNDEFMLATAVEHKEYHVDFKRGLHIKDMWYSSPFIGKVRGKKSELQVRLDPENPHVVYSLIENEWHPCYSSEINTFSSKSPVMQIVEGLTKYEAANMRLHVKDRENSDLVRIIREMDAFVDESSIIPVVEVSKAEDSQEVDSFFSGLDMAQVKPIKRESWG